MRREIFVDSATAELRIALLESDVVTELFVERPGDRGTMGNVYKGRVSSVLPGMNSAFVNIGLERDAFLYVEDVAGGAWEDEPPGARAIGAPDAAGPDPAVPGPVAAAVPVTPPPRIQDLLTEGQDIVVQVSKDPIGHKGARITTQISLAGRFLVYLPMTAHVGVSRKIEDAEERDRLRDVAGGLLASLGLGGGCIVRTVGSGHSADEFVADARLLGATWDEVRAGAADRSAPALLYQEVGALGRVLRDVLNDEVERVLIDSRRTLDEALAFVDRVHPALRPRFELYGGTAPIFEAHGIEAQIEKALRPRLWLKSGGSIVINQTEALVAIDVNTGKYVGGRRLEETILTTNLEAVRETVRQIRLRDLGGIIVIDFIDMEEAASREEVVKALEEEMRRDRSKSRIQPISPFGLVEITRQRTKRSLERILCRPCPACGGSGRVKSSETVCFEVQRALRREGAAVGARFAVRVHPDVAPTLEAQVAAPSSGGPVPFSLRVQADASLSRSDFSIEPD